MLRFPNGKSFVDIAGARRLRRARGGGLEAHPPLHRSSGAACRRRQSLIALPYSHGIRLPRRGCPLGWWGQQQEQQHCPSLASWPTLTLLPPHSLTRLNPTTAAKFLTYTLRSEPLAFISSFSPFAGASSASVPEQIRRSRPPRAPAADAGDVAARLPRPVFYGCRACVSGARWVRVWVPATPEPAVREQPSSAASWGLVCVACARRDALRCRL